MRHSQHLGGLIIVLALWVCTCFADPVLNAVNGHYYERIDGFFSWYEARDAAEALGGYLATITAAQEQDFIVNNLGGDLTKNHWLGAYQEVPRTGPWTWVTGEAWGYTNWAWWEPDGPYTGPMSVIFHDTAPVLGQWCDTPVDHFGNQGYLVEWNDQASIVPVPGAVVLGSIGLAFSGWRLRRRGA